MKSIYSFALFSVAFTCDIAPCVPSDRAGTHLTMASYGPARIGMSKSALELALGHRLKDLQQPLYGCRLLGFAGEQRVAFMVMDGNLVRVDVRSNAVSTPSGIHIGDSRVKLLNVYPGRIIETPHEYSARNGYADRPSNAIIWSESRATGHSAWLASCW